MTNMEKNEYSLKLKEYSLQLERIVKELKALSKETECNIDIYVSRMDSMHVWLHRGTHGKDDTMVSISNDTELNNAFLIDRDDTVREENEDGENNTEE